MIREAVSDSDVEAWMRVRNAVESHELASLDEVRRGLESDPHRKLLLAEVEGKAVGCGFSGVSESVPGTGTVVPRVVSAYRRRGVGTALLRECSAHAEVLGCGTLLTHVDGQDDGSLTFAGRRGFVEVDRQVELVRSLGRREAEPAVPPGIGIVRLEAEHLRAVRALAEAAALDMPLERVRPDVVAVWVEELERAPCAVVALAGSEPVGFAGLVELGARPGVLENTLTAVRRDQRGHGVATALKQALIVWAAANGYRELVTWTQKGNRAMQAVNEKVGYRTDHVSITLRGPLLP